MPKFIMLIGLPGSGKSELAMQIYKTLIARGEPCKILSSDSIRNEIYGDETVQRNPDKVFGLMNQRAIAALNKDITVIYDATNIYATVRRQLLEQLPPCEKIAVEVICSPDECVKRQNLRIRQVPEKVIRSMAAHLQAPRVREGWNTIKIVDNEFCNSANLVL